MLVSAKVSNYILQDTNNTYKVMQNKKVVYIAIEFIPYIVEPVELSIIIFNSFINLTNLLSVLYFTKKVFQ